MTERDPDHYYDPTTFTADDDIVTALGGVMLEALNVAAEQRITDQTKRPWLSCVCGSDGVYGNSKRHTTRPSVEMWCEASNAMFANIEIPVASAAGALKPGRGDTSKNTPRPLLILTWRSDAVMEQNDR